MKNVLVVIQNKDTKEILMLKTFDDEKQKYIWSLPNVRFHWNVQLPKKSGKLGAEHLYRTFTFGICKELFLKENKKHLLPSKNIMYYIEVSNECEKIPCIFESIQKNNNFKFNIIKLNFKKFEECLDVGAFSEYHYETIECLQFLFGH
jgi:hypothetical protein